MIARCQQRPIHHHHTQDSCSVSDAAAKALAQAHFPAGHSAICDCMASDGKIKPEDCENLNVNDSDGKTIARFSTREFSAKQNDDGGILVYRRPSLQKDSGLTLHRLNQIHAEFYKRGDL